jgi:hypothetical protein
MRVAVCGGMQRNYPRNQVDIDGRVVIACSALLVLCMNGCTSSVGETRDAGSATEDADIGGDGGSVEDAGSHETDPEVDLAALEREFKRAMCELLGATPFEDASTAGRVSVLEGGARCADDAFVDALPIESPFSGVDPSRVDLEAAHACMETYRSISMDEMDASIFGVLPPIAACREIVRSTASVGAPCGDGCPADSYCSRDTDRCVAAGPRGSVCTRADQCDQSAGSTACLRDASDTRRCTAITIVRDLPAGELCGRLDDAAGARFGVCAQGDGCRLDETSVHRCIAPMPVGEVCPDLWGRLCEPGAICQRDSDGIDRCRGVDVSSERGARCGVFLPQSDGSRRAMECNYFEGLECDDSLITDAGIEGTCQPAS